MTATQRVAQGLMVMFGLLTIVFYSSVYAATGQDAFPDDANALIATAGVALGVLVVALATVGINSGERWAWLALWVLPLFFLGHAILLGTWIPDGVLAALTVAALIVSRPLGAEVAATTSPGAVAAGSAETNLIQQPDVV